MSGVATVTTCTCPSCGASSGTVDYCDGCGAILQASEQPPATAGPGPKALSCPSCTAVRTPGDAFCEVCGLDFTTGQPLVPGSEGADGAAGAEPIDAVVADWAVDIGADRAFFDANLAEGGNLTFPRDLLPREVELSAPEMLVGRRNDAAGFVPDIDLSGDPAVSRRHVLLRRDADGSWGLLDLGSANGTWVNGVAAPVEPDRPISLHDGDRVHLGAFTAMRVHRTNPGAG